MKDPINILDPSIGTRDREAVFTRFFKCYVQRKGYREGYYGFLIGLFAGLCGVGPTVPEIDGFGPERFADRVAS